MRPGRALGKSGREKSGGIGGCGVFRALASPAPE